MNNRQNTAPEIQTHSNGWQKNQFFASMTMTFNGEIPASIVIHDAAGQRTEIVFDSPRTNIELSEDLFEFSAPADVDIVDQRTFAGDS